MSQSDVDQAEKKLADQNKDSARQELIGKFDKNNDIIISDSFNSQTGTPTVSPGVGQEANQATITGETTYTLTAIKKSDAKAVLHHYLQSKIQGEKDREIYDNGENNLKFSQYHLNSDGTATVILVTSGHIGPKIDKKKLAKQLEGLNYGSIQQKVGGIDGVENVDVKFSPFWVNKAPSSSKITIKFVVNKNGSS